MSRSSWHPDITMEPGQRVHGFIVEEVQPLPDLRAVAYRLHHDRSGARLLHLHAPDPENLLAIAFRTPPPDDTGLPHILEHTVLCGSRKYPVKDPFVELLKRSLATFLNAMTYPDKTVYPCASMVEKDFFNIADVYCDAVFHPLIKEEHFKQEGHHLAFAEPGNLDSPLIIKGVVYNEMKGAYSDLDGLIERKLTQSICPDNAYGRDSGGDPEAIPTLTYEAFRRFHERYYHPSNALIFIYGNIPTERHLDFLDSGYLRGFERARIDTTIEAQPRWREPHFETVPYPIGPHEDPARKAAVVITYLTNDVTEAIRSLAMTLLDYYLLGNAASPLRKALIDSKLGEELTDSGYANFQRDTFFTVGLKGTEARHAREILELVRETCQREIQRGLDAKKVEAAFHRLELASREIPGQYPLHLMDRVYRSWLYDADPLHNLRLNQQLAELRRRIETEGGFLERQLSELLLENPHCSVLTFVPDPKYMARKEADFRKRMEALKASMSRQQLQRIDEEARKLEALLGAPNPPEALATLPRLRLRDVPQEPPDIDPSVETVAGRPLLYTDVFSNGLNYLQLAVDLRGIEEDLIDYLPLYTEALRKMGAGDLDYAAMAELEAAHTGGVGAGLSVTGRVEDPFHVQPFLMLSSKAIDPKLDRMLEILTERFLRCDLSDLDRLRDVILQGRVARRSQIVPNGWHFALLHAGRHLSKNGRLAERLWGASQVHLFDELAREFDARREQIVEKLSRIRDFLLSRGRITASFVGPQDGFRRVKEYMEEMLGSLRGDDPPPEPSDHRPRYGTREALATPADVAFVAKTFPTVGADHPHAPALLMLSVHLSYGYLWEELRVKRGAYGARASFSPLNGVFSLASYRDPFIRETLETFEGAWEYVLERMDLSEEGLEQAIIGTLKTLDRPIRPGEAVGTALARYLRGETREFRLAFRSRLMALKADEVLRAVTEVLEPLSKRACICVLSSREKLEEVNRSLEPSAHLEISDL